MDRRSSSRQVPRACRAILVAKTDGSATRTLDVGSLEAIDPIYRAPDGREVIFVGHAAGAQLTDRRRPVRRQARRQRASPHRRADEHAHAGAQVLARWHADRVRRAPGRLRDDPVPRCSASSSSPREGGTPRILRDLPDTNDLEVVAAWSNDGTRLLVSSCHRSEARGHGLPIDDGGGAGRTGGPEVRIDVPEGFPELDGTVHVWAPDDRSILTTPLGPDGLPWATPLSWDPLTGRSTPAPWNGAGGPSWQRLAP